MMKHILRWVALPMMLMLTLLGSPLSIPVSAVIDPPTVEPSISAEASMEPSAEASPSVEPTPVVSEEPSVEATPTESKTAATPTVKATTPATPTKAPEKKAEPTQKPAPAKTPEPARIEGDTYVVKAGDTVSEIASRSGSTTKEISRCSKVSPNNIKAGQTLTLRCPAPKQEAPAKPEAPKPAPAKPEAPKQEAPKQAAPKQKAEPKKQAPAKQAAPKKEAPKYPSTCDAVWSAAKQYMPVHESVTLKCGKVAKSSWKGETYAYTATHADGTMTHSHTITSVVAPKTLGTSRAVSIAVHELAHARIYTASPEQQLAHAKALGIDLRNYNSGSYYNKPSERFAQGMSVCQGLDSWQNYKPMSCDTVWAAWNALNS